MPKIHIQESQDIAAPAEQIQATIRDLKSWQQWNPWLICDPNTQLTYAPDGNSYQWQSPRIGQGEIQLKEENPGSLHFQLNIQKPYKSQAQVQFQLKQTSPNQTRVQWHMHSSLPFYLFFLKPLMTTTCAMDFQRGLTMLKDHIEQDNIPYQLTEKRPVTIPAIHYIGIQRDTPIDQIGEYMSTDFQTLKSQLSQANIQPSGPPRSIYTKWDFKQASTTYIALVPVEAIPKKLPAGLTSGSIPEHQAHQVQHTGPYRHIGNAWARGYAAARAKEFRQHRQIKPHEIYLNDPQATPENQLQTHINLPLK